MVIAASTRRLLGNLFEYHDLGAVAAKGFNEPVHAFEVLVRAASKVGLRRFTRLPSPRSLAAKRKSNCCCVAGRGQRTAKAKWCCYRESAGIGKSRIAAATMERLQGEPHTRLRYFCSPHHQASALYPFISQLEHAAGFERDDAPERKLDRLEALLAQASRNVARDAAFWPTCCRSRAGADIPRWTSVLRSARKRP